VPSGAQGIHGWVAPTHQDWFDYLSQRRRWPEVNFWRPSDYHAFRGEPGTPFFFKLKAPHSRIGGFGYVASFSKLPEWLAWECFGEANGAPTFEALGDRLEAIRKKSDLRGKSALRQIGCIVLVDVVFFPRDDWIAQPRDWPNPNLVPMRYDLSAGEGLRIWRQCQERAVSNADSAFGIESPFLVRERAGPGARWGEPMLVRPRLGQGAFRVAVTDAYGRACAVTHEHSLPALEAAHIRPFAQEGPHEVSNGLLLRSDLHRLFDRGYVTVTPDHRLEVSRLLKDHFSNGRSYYPLHGEAIALPARPADHPDSELVRYHNEVIFRG
jgi:putative restriction endonuclease